MKVKIILLLAVTIFFTLLIFSYQSLKKTKAEEDKVDISFIPKEGNFPIDEEEEINILIKPLDESKKISGLRIKIIAEDNLIFKDINSPAPFPNNNNISGTEVSRSLSEKNIELAYVYPTDNEEALPSAVQIKLLVIGKNIGPGTIKIDAEKTEISGTTLNKIFALNNIDQGKFNFINNSDLLSPTSEASISPSIIPSMLTPPTDQTSKSVYLKFDPSILIIESPMTEFSLFFLIDEPTKKTGISAFYTQLNFDPSLIRVKNIYEPLTFNNEQRYSKIINEFNNEKGEIYLSYLSNSFTELPNDLKLKITFEPKKIGTGEIVIKNPQITGNIPENSYLPIINNAVIKILEEPSSENININLNLSLKFQGIRQKPADQYNQMNVKIYALSPTNIKYCGIAPVSSNNDGIWLGKVSWHQNEEDCQPVPSYSSLSNIKLLIKGPKHLKKRICDPQPTETYPGSYRCNSGQITLQPGDNNLNLSGIYLLVGDLPQQDGIVNAYDASLVRQCLDKKDNQCIAWSDLNLDGIVNAQDYSLIIEALSIRTDEE